MPSMIERYLIHYFLAVVDHGNFSRAAQQCGVSQPTLSVGIAKLEASVGALLFHRTNRRVELTETGVRFALHARRIELEFSRAQQLMVGSPDRRLIRLGVISTLPSVWIERACRAATAEADERLEIVEGRMGDLAPRLERGRIDAILGLLANGASSRDMLFEEDYALVLPADHPLAGRGRVDAEEVADAPMIVRRHCEALSAVSHFFTQRGVRPFFSARTMNDDRTVAMVRAGLGITVMPRCFGGQGVAMPALTGFTLRRRIGWLTVGTSGGRVRDSRMFARFSDTIRASAADENLA